MDPRAERAAAMQYDTVRVARPSVLARVDSDTGPEVSATSAEHPVWVEPATTCADPAEA
jgi:hypothetical protein